MREKTRKHEKGHQSNAHVTLLQARLLSEAMDLFLSEIKVFFVNHDKNMMVPSFAKGFSSLNNDMILMVFYAI